MAAHFRVPELRRYMESKIRVKVGSIEVEYEGTQDFIEKGLLGFLASLAEAGKSALVSDGGGGGGDGKPPVFQGQPKSVSQVAQSAHVKSGPELVMAAAQFLAGPAGHKDFSRRELLIAMQSAKTFYKKNYSGNLTHALKRLVHDGKLNDLGNENYSLPSD